MSETWTGPSGTYDLVPVSVKHGCTGCALKDDIECDDAPCVTRGACFILRRKETPSYRPEGVRCIYEALSGHVILARPCDEANAVVLLNSTLTAMDAAVEEMRRLLEEGYGYVCLSDRDGEAHIPARWGEDVVAILGRTAK